MAELDASLQAWVETVTGGRVTRARRTYGGGTRGTWFLDVETKAPEQTRLVLRTETGQSPFGGTPLSLGREAVVYRALRGTAVRIPTLHGEEPTGRALLLERLDGTSDLARLPSDERRTALEDLVDQLAALHSLNPDTLTLPGFDRPSIVAEHALNDLTMWREISAACAQLDPEIEFALGWLRANPPSSVQRTVLVQGDTGPGNFMTANGQVTGLIDWEFAHLGDPIDDLAWLQFRACGQRTTVVDNLQPLLDRYESVSGIRVDRRSLTYYAAFVQLRCAITTRLTIDRGGNLGLALYHAYHRRFLRAMVEAIAQAEGIDVAAEQPEPPAPTGRTALYDRVLEHLQEGILPATTSRDVKLRVNEATMLVRHLRSADLMGPAVDDAERRDLSKMLDAGRSGYRGTDAALRNAARRCGPHGDPRMLTYLVHRARRAESLWADALR